MSGIFNDLEERNMITKEQIINWFCERNQIKKEELDKYHRYAIANVLKYAQEQVKNCNIQRVCFNEADNICNVCHKPKRMQNGILQLLCECSEVEVCPDCGYKYVDTHDKGWHNKQMHGKDWQT